MTLKNSFILVSVFALMSFYVKERRSFTYPSYFPKPLYDFKNKAPDSLNIYIGRSLFYDPVLSADNTVSCASCHAPFSAFAHTDHDLSHGINDLIGSRNAPALFNLAWQPLFMWDGAVNHIEVQALAPIHHPKEMGSSIDEALEKLNASTYYKSLFYTLYRDSFITGEKTLKALAQFQLSLLSFNARYDKVKQGQEQFTEQEQKGYKLFQKHCNSCHTEPLFSNYGFANNGLAVDTSLNDYGRQGVTQRSEDSLLFKVPSLRNLSYSFPYMHDGRFKKLSEVLKHYTSGIVKTATLSEALQEPIVLNADERVELIAFLLTLNDSSFVFNEQYHFPKK